jgi:protein associated with RNAse G/E
VNRSKSMATGRRLITVHARKYNGEVYRSWTGFLIRSAGTLTVLEGHFETEINHPLLGKINEGTRSTEYYWTDRWYNIFRFEEPEGAFRNYYCNVSQPAEISGDQLSFIDLDIDVLVAHDRSIRVLDEAEFERHSKLYGYSAGTITNAYIALDEIKALVNNGHFPFSDF